MLHVAAAYVATAAAVAVAVSDELSPVLTIPAIREAPAVSSDHPPTVFVEPMFVVVVVVALEVVATLRTLTFPGAPAVDPLATVAAVS